MKRGLRDRGIAADVADLELFQQGLHLLVDLGRGQRAAVLADLQFKHGPDVLFHREAADHRGVLGQVRQAHARALVDRHRRDDRAVDFDAAGIRGHQAHDHVEAGGLAGALGAQKAHDFAADHGQGDVLHHGPAVIGLAQTGCAQAALLDPRGGGGHGGRHRGLVHRGCEWCCVGSGLTPFLGGLLLAAFGDCRVRLGARFGNRTDPAAGCGGRTRSPRMVSNGFPQT
ncbi:hypothetical protein G6F31_016427 [Rhizopus arrhizus]|nr:hypothetical protein G6F31_016427 [Rhizopus arrhizus]